MMISLCNLQATSSRAFCEISRRMNQTLNKEREKAGSDCPHQVQSLFLAK
jgi:hypothetical protein